MSSPLWILEPPFVPLKSAVSKLAQIEHLANLAGVLPELIEPIIPERTSRGHILPFIPGLELPRGLIETKQSKVCPNCLREISSSKTIWSLSIWTCCPRHASHLINSCPKCGKNLTWYRSGVDRCADADCPGRPSESPTSRPSSLEMEVANLLGCIWDRNFRPPSSRLTETFGHLSTAECVTLISRLGAHVGHASDSGKTRLARAADVLADWPRGWHALITSSQEETTRGGISVLSRYPSIQRLLEPRKYSRSSLPESARVLLVQHFLSYIDDTDTQNSARRTSFSGEDQSARRWMPCKTAAKLLGTDKSTIIKMVALNKFMSRTIKINNKHLFLDRREVEAYKSHIENIRDCELLTLSECADRLGCHLTGIYSLIKAGQIEKVELFTTIKVRASSITALIEMLSVRAAESTAGRRHLMMRALNVLGNVTVAKIVTEMLEGRLPFSAVSTPAASFRDFDVARSDALQCAERFRLSRRVVHNRDAAAILSCDRSDINRLVLAGLLDSGGRAVVTEESLTEFASQSITDHETCRQRGGTRAASRAWLANQGHALLLDVATIRNTASFWSRQARN